MRAILVLSSLAALAPGAVSGQQPPNTAARAPATYMVDLPGNAVWLRLDTVSAWVMVPGDSRSVFRSAVQVYQALKIPTDIVDSTREEVGNLKIIQSRTFAGQRISAWLSCGESMTGPNADSHRIYMAVVSGVERVSDDSSRVRTLFTGTARNMGGNASNPVRCVTTGGFEQMLARRIAETVKKGG